jgi:CdiI N-terminal domain
VIPGARHASRATGAAIEFSSGQRNGVRLPLTPSKRKKAPAGNIVAISYASLWAALLKTLSRPFWFWKVPDYEQQWAQGMQRLLNGASKSCLITSLTEPTADADCAFGCWWKLYRNSDKVLVQQQLLLEDFLGKEFDVSGPYRSIPACTAVCEHRAQSLDGSSIR